MKYLLIISCLLFTSVGWSKDISLDDLIERDGLYYEKFTDKPFTGKVTGIKQGKIRKGIKKGKWKEYWESGILKESYTIKRGNYDSEYIEYTNDGKLKMKALWEEGKLDSGEGLIYFDGPDDITMDQMWGNAKGLLFYRLYFNSKGVLSGDEWFNFILNGEWHTNGDYSFSSPGSKLRQFSFSSMFYSGIFGVSCNETPGEYINAFNCWMRRNYGPTWSCFFSYWGRKCSSIHTIISSKLRS